MQTGANRLFRPMARQTLCPYDPKGQAAGGLLTLAAAANEKRRTATQRHTVAKPWHFQPPLAAAGDLTRLTPNGGRRLPACLPLTWGPRSTAALASVQPSQPPRAAPPPADVGTLPRGARLPAPSIVNI